MSDEWVELTGDEIPYHLRLDAPPLAACDRCGRESWDSGVIGTTDQMTQPNGQRCGGTFVTP